MDPSQLFGIFQSIDSNNVPQSRSATRNEYTSKRSKNLTLPYYFSLFTNSRDVTFRPFIATDWSILDNYQIPSPPQSLNIPSETIISTLSTFDKSQIALKIIRLYKDALLNTLASTALVSSRSAKRISMLSSMVNVLSSQIENSINQLSYEKLNAKFCMTSPLDDYYKNHFDVYMDLWLRHIKSMPHTLYCWKNASNLITEYEMLSEDTTKLLPLSKTVAKMVINKLDYENIDFNTSVTNDGLNASFSDVHTFTNFCATNLADILKEFGTEENVNALFEHRRKHREERRCHLESLQSMINVAISKYHQAFTLLDQKKSELNKISSKCLDELFPVSDPKDIAREIIHNFEKLSNSQ